MFRTTDILININPTQSRIEIDQINKSNHKIKLN